MEYKYSTFSDSYPTEGLVRTEQSLDDLDQGLTVLVYSQPLTFYDVIRYDLTTLGRPCTFHRFISCDGKFDGWVGSDGIFYHTGENPPTDDQMERWYCDGDVHDVPIWEILYSYATPEKSKWGNFPFETLDKYHIFYEW